MRGGDDVMRDLFNFLFKVGLGLGCNFGFFPPLSILLALKTNFNFGFEVSNVCAI